jgi:hypothetical protein
MKNACWRRLTVIFGLWGALVLGGLATAAAQGLEIIELRHRSADQVLPALLPLVEAGGTLTGLHHQLFLRASPRNRDEIRRVLAALDQPQKRLLIRVALDRQQEASGRGLQGSGQVVLGSTRRAEAEARVWDTRSVRGEQAAQSVQTLDGQRAFIQVGRSLPMPLRQVVIGPGGAVISEQVVYRDLGQGFHAIPYVQGDRVRVEIVQQAEALAPSPRGAIDSQRLSTTLSGRLGEWMELGGSGRQALGRDTGNGFSVGTHEQREQRSLWLKVEELE